MSSANEDETQMLRGFYAIPDRLWVLQEIVDWIAYRGGAAPEEGGAAIKAASDELRTACLKQELRLLGARADSESSQIIGWEVFSDPVWFDLSSSSVEADPRSAPPGFARGFQPWQRVKALDDDVRARWPAKQTAGDSQKAEKLARAPKRSRKQDIAKQAIKELYPDGNIPDAIMDKELFGQVVAHAQKKARASDSVPPDLKKDTVLRAAGRRKDEKRKSE